jgi:hypothetical protein
MAPEVASSWAATRESPSLRDLAAAASAQLQALGQEFQLRAEALGDLEARAFALDAQRRAMEAWAAHVEMMLAQAPRSAEVSAEKTSGACAAAAAAAVAAAASTAAPPMLPPMPSLP